MAPALKIALPIALLVAPGYLFLTGYRQGRSYTIPDRDLYVLAQAVVASLGWISLIWLVLPLGNPIKAWGLLPVDVPRIEHHQTALATLLLSVEFLPFALGLVVGPMLGWATELSWVYRRFYWTGLLERPTAWDHAWNQVVGKLPPRVGIDVTVRLKSGAIVTGSYGDGSRADLSPRSARDLYLETGRGYSEGKGELRLFASGESGGVFIAASEIETVFFSIPPADGPQHENDPRTPRRV